MKGFGSGDFGEFTFMDYIDLISLIIGIQNLELNITQEDMDNQTAELDAKVDKALTEIQAHLKMQDKKIDLLLEGTKK